MSARASRAQTRRGGSPRQSFASRAGASRALSRLEPAEWAVVALTVLAGVLRWSQLRQSLFGDELFLYAIVHDRSLGHVFSAIRETEKTPPLGFVLGWLFARGSSADVLVRLPSFVAGVATVPLVYLVGVRTVGRRAGIVAAAGMALSPFEIFYSTESRGYALVTALVVLSTLCLLAGLERRGRGWWVLYALVATAAVYTHYIAALSVIPQAAWALGTHRNRARELLAANALVVAAFLPWLPSFLDQARHSTSEAAILDKVAPLSLSRVSEITGRALVGHPFVSLDDIPGRLGLTILAALLAASLVALAHGARTGAETLSLRLTARGGLVVALAMTPLAGLVAYSLRPNTSFLLARNLSGAVPYALLCIGWLLTRPGKRVGVALSVSALAVASVGTVKALGPDHQRPDVRDAAGYIDANAAPTDPVVDWQFAASGTPPARGLRLYLERPHRVLPREELASVWGRAARDRTRVFISFFEPSRLPAVLTGFPAPDPGIFDPPTRYATSFRLVAEHTSRGLIPIVVREYAPA